jgi:hypothetical protein
VKPNSSVAWRSVAVVPILRSFSLVDAIFGGTYALPDKCYIP